MYYYLLLIVGVIAAHYLIKKKIYKVIMGGINVVMLMGAIQYDGLTPFIKWLSLIAGVTFLVGGIFFKKKSIFRSLGYMIYIIMIYVAMRYYGVTTGTETFVYLMTNRIVVGYLIGYAFNVAYNAMNM